MKKNAGQRPSRARKRAQCSANIVAELHSAIAEVGGGGYLKVILPDASASHRVIEVVPTLEDDIILVLEHDPCWRRRINDTVPSREEVAK
jgi:adenylate kinase